MSLSTSLRDYARQIPLVLSIHNFQRDLEAAADELDLLHEAVAELEDKLDHALSHRMAE